MHDAISAYCRENSIKLHWPVCNCLARLLVHLQHLMEQHVIDIAHQFNANHELLVCFLFSLAKLIAWRRGQLHVPSSSNFENRESYSGSSIAPSVISQFIPLKAINGSKIVQTIHFGLALDIRDRDNSLAIDTPFQLGRRRNIGTKGLNSVFLGVWSFKTIKVFLVTCSLLHPALAPLWSPNWPFTFITPVLDDISSQNSRGWLPTSLFRLLPSDLFSSISSLSNRHGDFPGTFVGQSAFPLQGTVAPYSSHHSCPLPP